MIELIIFNLIQYIIWFTIMAIIAYKTGKYEKFYSNWLIPSVLTGVLSLGIYFWFK